MIANSKAKANSASIRQILDALNQIAAVFVSKYEAKVSTINDFKDIITNTSNKQMKPTYASMVQSKPFLSPPKTKLPEMAIIVKPNNKSTISKIELEVKQVLRESTNNYKIVYVKNTGNVIVIRALKSEVNASLVDELKSKANIGPQCAVYLSKAKKPTVVIKNIRDVTDLKDIVSQISCKNDELKDLENEIEYLFPMKNRNRDSNTTSVALSVSPRVYQTIEKMDEHIFVYSQRLQVDTHKVFVRQCQKCFQYSHKTKDCKGNEICRSCGKTKGPGHSCTTRCCINCNSSEKYKGHIDHFPNSDHCPIYKLKEERIREQTEYQESQ